MTINELKTKQLEYAISKNTSQRIIAKGIIELIKLYNSSVIDEPAEQVKLSVVAEKAKDLWTKLYKVTGDKNYLIYNNAADLCIIKYMSVEDLSLQISSLDPEVTFEEYLLFIKNKNLFNKAKYATVKSVYDILNLSRL